MKLIIAGTRDLDIHHTEVIHVLIKQFGIVPTEIVSGHSGDVDLMGELYASNKGIPLKKFPADWNKHGKAAGPIRNREMAVYADELLLIWDGKSKGSHNMRHEMYKTGKPIHEVITRRWNEKTKDATQPAPVR